MRGYAICTEPRSGSVFLSRVLTSTGVLGRPNEYFNVVTMRIGRFGRPDYPSDREQQLAAIPRLGATPNGVYGLKIFSDEFDALKPIRWAERLPALSFIHLERHDLLGQAISHVRAAQTQQWTSVQPAQGAPVYDYDLINNEIIRLARAHTRWRYFFARNGLPVLNLVYERVMRAPQETAEAVARLVGLADLPRVDIDTVAGLAIQRDAVTEDWRARFLSRSRDLGTFH
jgi:LPS sulfotransferase NodH